jgi:hypothetical protein
MTAMPQYLLTVVTPSGQEVPPPEVLEPIMRDVQAVDEEMRRAGAWVFSGGLAAPSSATTLRPKDGEVLLVDGPFIEGREYLGGFSIITAPDLDTALDWGRKLARATTLPIEVRPFHEG